VYAEKRRLQTGVEMVASVDMVKVVMGGIISSTDTWSTGYSFKVSGGVPSAADLNGLCNAAGVQWVTDFWTKTTTGYRNHTSTAVTWNSVKAYYYPAGSVVATVTGSKPPTPDSGTAGVGLPPQCALVASLLTGLAGRHNRGRSYLPMPVGVLSNGRLTGTTMTDVANNLAIWLGHMNTTTVGALSFNACVGTGSCPSLTQVRVDDIVDTQRRRRDKQVPSTVITASI
jgi:hypothetical protein